MAEQFDEKKYKQEHDYDSKYDKYLLDVMSLVLNDANGYGNVTPSDGITFNISSDVNVKDSRSKNSVPNIVLTEAGRVRKSSLQPYDRPLIDKAVTKLKVYTISPASYTPVKEIWDDIQKAKSSNSKFKDENGESPTPTGNETPEQPVDNKDVSIAKTDNAENNYSYSEQEVSQAGMAYYAADPRLARLDSFMSTDENGDDGIYLPFASNTAATAFADLNWTIEKAVARELCKVHPGFYASKLFLDNQQFTYDRNAPIITNESTSDILIDTSKINYEASDESKIRESDKVFVNDPNEFMNDGNLWGVKSIMNNFSLTSLVGGLRIVPNEGIINYMYDIRDRRRFYGISVMDDADVLAVSNPTVTQIINWSNHDKWGRTPYTFQDFAYCKYFGLMTNNRLMTLRRYHAPTYDNLQFESMFGEIETTSVVDSSSGRKKTEKINEPDYTNTKNPKTFSPIATVVTWFGGDTGNQLSNLMSFTSGIPWEDLKSKIHEVSGEQGSDPQAVIDSMFAGGGFGGNPLAEHGPISAMLRGANIVTGSIFSFGKFALALNGRVGMEDQVLQNYLNANGDPYQQIYQNRIQGPLNRIDTVKKRSPGIVFQQLLQVKCAYKAKAIGGINPKAALLDCLGNAMEIVSPTAVFWGGGHRFMVKPHTYPYHDGGWRDSFMKKIFDGNIIGHNGAIAMAMSGFKKMGTDERTGEWSLTGLTNTLTSAIGDGLSLIGAALNSVTSLFGNANNLVSLWFNNKGAEMRKRSETEQKEIAEKRSKNLFTNLETMWHNKVMQQTQLPNITGNAALLVGEPIGEWHLTVGNPLNPIMVIGNLICTQMQVAWDEELGPDDFPTGFEVTYTLEHAMARDKESIQSMFNRGSGRFYKLPDYIKCSSDYVTYVDKFTKNGGGGDVGNYKIAINNVKMNRMAGYGSGYGYAKVSPGSEPTNAGNPATTLVTKFKPINPYATKTIGDIWSQSVERNIPIIKSLATTRKRIE